MPIIQKKYRCFFIFWIVGSLMVMRGGNFLHTDTIKYPRKYILSDKGRLKFDKITSARWFQMTYIPVPLIIGGVILDGEKDHFRNLRNEYIPNFRYHYDDYLQYAPIVAMLGMKIGGVESRSSWGRMLVSDAFSAAIMASAVNILKATKKSERPDGSAYNSFPSGHTATAFMAATMFHKEYGMRSPWYSVGAYSVATATAISRQLNNKHWISDVMVGAGVGMLSTELGYLLADLIFKNKGLNYSGYDFDPSLCGETHSFFGLYLGYTLIPHHIKFSSEIDFHNAVGSTTGLEGAWYMNPYLGFGGRVTATSVPTDLRGEAYFGNQSVLSDPDMRLKTDPLNSLTAAAGPYFSLPISYRWALGSKLLLGYTYSPGNKAYLYKTGEDGKEISKTELISLSHIHSFCMGTGLSVSYWAKKNLGVRFFCDYNLIPASVNYMETSRNNGLKESHDIFHSFTLGGSVNIILSPKGK